MKKQQLIELLQFIAVWIIIYLFCVYVLKQSFVDFVLHYRFFFLVASISYFYYYSIQYEPDKKYELIRNAVLLGNFYLFAHIFFRPLLNISHELFVLLGLIILGFWGTTKMKSRWKYLLQGLGLLFSFFILISGTLYFYPDKPDIEGFMASRNYEISAVGVSEEISKRDAYIQIDNFRRVEEYELTPGFTRALSESCEISYPSNKLERDEKVVLMTPEGEIFWIFPQSKIQLDFSGKKLVKISKLAGGLGVLSGVFDGKIEFIGEKESLSSQQIEELNNLQEEYKIDLVAYLKDQISDSNISLANGTIMYDIDGRILKFLAKMFPTSFGKNLKNYNEFMYYFSWVDTNEIDLERYSSRSTKGSVKSMWESLKEGFRNGKKDTYLLKKY